MKEYVLNFNNMLLLIDFYVVLTDWDAASDEIRRVKSKSILLYKQRAIKDNIASPAPTLSIAVLEMLQYSKIYFFLW